MAYTVVNYLSEKALEDSFVSGTVTSYASEDALDAALDALSGETITALITKGIGYTLVLDAVFASGTLVNIVCKHNQTFTVILDVP